MRNWYFVPVVVVAALVALLGYTLNRDSQPDPQAAPTYVPSPLIGKPVPHFDVMTLYGAPARFTQTDLKGEVRIINFFASWCVSCKLEHPFLMQLARVDKVRIIGVDYKDTSSAVRQDLAERGNPYRLVLLDPDGTMGLNFGVYGVPETYVIDARGIVRYKCVGPLTPQIWRKHVQPLLQTSRG